VLHGFNAVHWAPSGRWIFLDARGNSDAIETECRFEPPWSLVAWPEAERGESFLPFIYRRPAKRIVDLLERVPNFETLRRSLPDSL
jgi:hypothetical protein